MVLVVPSREEWYSGMSFVFFEFFFWLIFVRKLRFDGLGWVRSLYRFFVENGLDVFVGLLVSVVFFSYFVKFTGMVVKGEKLGGL